MNQRNYQNQLSGLAQAQQQSYYGATSCQSAVGHFAMANDFRLGQHPVLIPTKGTSMFSAVARDVKEFFVEHRAFIYFLVIALVIDHLVFRDAFRNRLQGVLDKMIAKIENKVAQP